MNHGHLYTRIGNSRSREKFIGLNSNNYMFRSTSEYLDTFFGMVRALVCQADSRVFESNQ